jgi:hypothetical protein
MSLERRVASIEKQSDEIKRDAIFRRMSNEQLLELNQLVIDAGDDVRKVDYSQMSDGLRNI